MQAANGFKKLLYALLAGIFFILGVIGVILPGLPGTPFFLLTSYFLVRTFPKLNDALLRSNLIGPILKDWQQRGGVQARVKIRAVSVVCLAVGLSMLLVDLPLSVKLTISALAVLGIVVILRLPTVE